MRRWKKKFGDKLRDMPLFRKMMFFYIMLLCIPAAIMGAFYVGTLVKRLDGEYDKSKAEVLEQACLAVDHISSQVEYCRNSFQYNSMFLQYVSSYDLTTGEGVQMWLQYVKPAFDQIKTANPGFTNICVWRGETKESNDPRYVLNAEENEELDQNLPMKYTSKQLVFETEEENIVCRIYQELYNVNGFHGIGYVEVDCDFNTLFGTMRFVGDKELLLLTYGEQTWRVCEKDGAIYLCEAPEEDTVFQNHASRKLEKLDVTMDYYYPNLSVLGNSSLWNGVIAALLLFAFFSIVYYIFYISITKRITRFSEHMQQSEGKKMELYQENGSRDEIGAMIHSYNETASRVNALNEEVIQKVRLANHARYYAMQSQIQPHFLYNTLENIDMLVELGENEKASRMMNLFGKILRYNLSYQRKMITVEQEIQHAEDYLKLYSYRMRDDFEYRVEMEPTCAEVECPYCMMQPVVENCFKHAFRYQDRVLWVHIHAWCENGYVIIDVEDNGTGITAERLEEIHRRLAGKAEETEEKESTSVGLYNVNERVQLLCGLGSGIFVEPLDQGCRVRLKINMYPKGAERNGNENTDRR